jgi:hypothetical protein
VPGGGHGVGSEAVNGVPASGALEAELTRLRLSVGTLVPVERAVGVLAERLRMPYEDAQALLTRSADRAGRETVALAAEIVPGGPTPPSIVAELDPSVVRRHS